MMEEKSNERVMVFIDLENVVKAVKEFGNDIRTDFEEMARVLVGGRTLVRTFVFDGRSSGNTTRTALHVMLREQGFRVVTRKSYEKETAQQKEVDVAMACGILSNAYKDNYDTAIIVSGDRDFRPVMEEVQGLGKKVEVAGFSESMSKVLSMSCDVFHNMDTVPLFYLAPEAMRYYEEFVSEFFAMPEMAMAV